MTIFRVFVTPKNQNPIEALKGDCSTLVFKDFNNMKEARDFSVVAIGYGFNISLNVWDEEED